MDLTRIAQDWGLMMFTNLFATTSLHIAWITILWAIVVMITIVVVLFLLIAVGGIMVAYSKAKQLKKERR
jgi:hypothetical protein